MSRLSVSLLAECPIRINPINQRELNCRARGVRQLEEEPLALLDDNVDSVDLSKNSLTALEGFPEMKRLTSILAHGNNICRIGRSTGTQLPNLETLVCNDNGFKSLSELENIADFKKLQRVSFMRCPVQSETGYRLFLISRCPTLKLIDFQRVLDSERVEAKKQFPPLNRPKKSKRNRQQAAAETAAMATAAAAAATTGGHVKVAALTEEEFDHEMEKLNQRIDDAETEEEMAALQDAIEELEAKRPRK